MKSSLISVTFLLLISSSVYGEDKQPCSTATASVAATVINPVSISLSKLSENNKNGDFLHIIISKNNNQTIINFE